MKKILLFLLVMFFLSSMFVAYSNQSLLAAEEDKKPCQHNVVKCPVSGEVITKDAMNIKTVFKGKTYYFCCEGCKAKFEKNPEKYAKSCSHHDVYHCPEAGCKYTSDKPGKCPKCGVELKKHVSTTSYICPMKKCNYKSDKPGKCPKCGMELKKVECTCTDHKTKCTHKKKEKKEDE